MFSMFVPLDCKQEVCVVDKRTGKICVSEERERERLGGIVRNSTTLVLFPVRLYNRCTFAETLQPIVIPNYVFFIV